MSFKTENNMTVTKTVRGKRPKIYDQQGLDHLMAITTALVQEVAVLRDRIDLVERVAESKGVILKDEIETYMLNQNDLEARELWRNKYLGRIYAVFEQETAELAAKDTEIKYQSTLDQIAKT